MNKNSHLRHDRDVLSVTLFWQFVFLLVMFRDVDLVMLLMVAGAVERFGVSKVGVGELLQGLRGGEDCSGEDQQEAGV